MIHQRLYGNLQRPRDYYLTQSQAAGFFDQLERAGKDGGLQDGFEQLVSEEPHPIFGLAFVPLEEKVVENFSAILVADGEQRDTQQGCGAFPHAAEEVGLVSSIKPQSVNKVRAD
jgi:hypothetical protein